MNPRGRDFQFLRQFFWPLCHANGLLKVDYVVDRQPDLVEVFSAVRDDFMQVSVLLDPVGHGPGDVTESPVAFDTATVSHLILVHHEKVLQLPVAIFNSPSEPIEICDFLSGKTRFICDQNVYFLLVLFPVGAEEDHEFQRDITVLELSFKEVGLDRLGFSLCRFESYWLYLVPIVFFDEGNELVLLHEAALSFNGMVNQDITVCFDLSYQGELSGVQVLEQLGRMRVPGIEDHSRKPDFFGYGVVDEFLCELNLASEFVSGLFIKLLLSLIKIKIDRKALGRRDKCRGDEDVAHGLATECSAMLVLGAFSILGVDLRARGIVDGKHTVRSRASRSMFFDKSDSFVVELVVIPFGIGKEILQVLVITGRNPRHDFHVGSFHVFEQKTDVEAEVEELAPGEEARKPAKKFVDETAVDPENTHILCSWFGSDGLSQLPTIKGAKEIFYRESPRKASNERNLRFTELTFMDYFREGVFYRSSAQSYLFCISGNQNKEICLMKEV